jgi:hypothetical protein
VTERDRNQRQLQPLPDRAVLWGLRWLATWLVNLAALALAGLVVTNVGANDPFAYLAWAAVFALVNSPPVARLGRRRFGPIGAVVLPAAVDFVMVWMMTVFAPPFHAPDLASIAKAAAIMWAVNIPLRAVNR